MSFPALADSTLLAIAVYVGLAGLYLLVIPVALLYYLRSRWNVAGSVERLILYSSLFVVFPNHPRKVSPRPNQHHQHQPNLTPNARR